MADLETPTEEQLADWEAWCSSRPPEIAEIARRLPPWKLYLLKTTDQRVVLHSYSEADPPNYPEPTVTVQVLGKFNFLMFDRQVFGINPNDLEECDFPEDGEITGTVIADENVGEFIDSTLRPSLLGSEEAERIRLEIANDDGA